MKISIAKKTSPTFKSTLIVIGVLLATWECAARYIGQEIYLPSFSKTAQVLLELLGQKDFLLGVATSILRVGTGFFAAMILGSALGLLGAFHGRIKQVLSPIMAILKSTPVASFILLFLIWMNSSVASVLIGIIMLTPIFYANALLGVEELDEKLTQVCMVYEMKMGTYLKKIVLPSLVPYIRSAMLTALGFAYKTVVSAEVIAGPKYGIGTMLYQSKLYLETPALFACTLTIIALSMAFETLIRKWAGEGTEQKEADLADQRS